ncbi:hypothetical protein [Hydrogenophaga aquatica]
MYLVVLGWVYVAVLMALAEAFSANGTILGAIVTLILYGFVPVSLILYFISRKQRKFDAAKAAEAAASGAPDAGGHAPGAAEAGSVTPVREEK